jgi:hypothetical protein
MKWGTDQFPEDSGYDPAKIFRKFIMDSYWDLYVAYVHHCVEYNKRHDIDPHHHEMEWNHFLPRSIFDDQPIGHYLLLKQHAIASALQTLAFKRNCMCGWHKKHLPEALLSAAWPYFCRATNETGSNSPVYKNSPEYLQTRRKSGENAVQQRTGVHSEEYKNSPKYAEDRKRGRETQRQLGIGIYAVWESTVDGWKGSAGLVARHNKLNGWDPAARVKIS